MHEKELRLALVCYGGVSLAIYMSGVTKEVLKVVRASRAYHSIVDPQERGGACYDDAADINAYETDTERLYFELLQTFAPQLELRVVVDIISGASAGGINGILLARALAHDLSLDDHRTMWLENADVTRLMEPDTIADRWSKFYLYPLLWVMNIRRLRALVPNAETRSKLSIFVRSRWFKPPFSGKHMLEFMLDATSTMDRKNCDDDDTATHSLIPPGLRLDLFVSLTNFYGRHQAIQLHDPEQIVEREHRKSLVFSSDRRQSGRVISDFGDDNVPGLAFAARATSSFPGAFPPAQLKDLDVALEQRGEVWPGRARFMQRNFPWAVNQASIVDSRGTGPARDPAILSFIDGAVVNNKPFAAAIDALADRPAQREVDRRIVYIDPVPEDLSLEAQEASPGFFRTILASLSEIPRNEPINDELNWVNHHNRQSQRLHNVMVSVKSEVDDIIDDLIPTDRKKLPGVALVASWRDQINAEAKEQAGYAYNSYSHTKTHALFDRLARLLCDLCATLGYAVTLSDLTGHLYNWGRFKRILSDVDRNADRIDIDASSQADTQILIRFLRDFDVDFRIRRLRFVISALNGIYQSDVARQADSFDPHQLNDMKRALYLFVDQLKDRWKVDPYVDNARSDIAALGNALDAAPIGARDEVGVDEHVQSALTVLMKRLADLMELQERDFTYDQTISDQIGTMTDPDIRRELFRAYIGFPFFDVLTVPLLQSMDLSELDPIRVDRISPEDCNTIRAGGAEKILKGIGFARFAAFFSRADRENDYLWGRLNSSERLVDFIINSARHSDVSTDLDITAFKKRLFLSILDAETPHLTTDASLIEALRTEIMAITPDQDTAPADTASEHV